MGYRGGEISSVTRRAQEGAKLAGHRMAKLGSEIMTDHTKENTPVGEPDPFDRDADGRHLRDLIDEKPVSYDGIAWSGGTETFVEYGPYVEEGTGLWGPERRHYIIRPRDPNGVLAFFARAKTPEGRPVLSNSATQNLATGTLVFARFVRHPGSPGQHMFAIGAQMTEADLPQIGTRGMRVMRMYVERAIT